jgi:4'-phosphopantetheinyl transferase
MTDSSATFDVSVFLWSLRLDRVEPSQRDAWWDWLAEDEQQRAEKFRFERHRQAFVTGRVFLRGVLARHLGASPADIRFRQQSLGKPELQAPVVPWQFNFSRSGNVAVCGLTSQRRIGVDVEQVRTLTDLESLARTIYDDADQRQWQMLPDCRRTDTFFRSWARKEALGKADGSGISEGAKNLRVPLQPLATGHCHVICQAASGGSPVTWCLSDWHADSTVAASLVVETRCHETWLGYDDQSVRLDELRPAAGVPLPAGLASLVQGTRRIFRVSRSPESAS